MPFKICHCSQNAVCETSHKNIFTDCRFFCDCLNGACGRNNPIQKYRPDFYSKKSAAMELYFHHTRKRDLTG